MDDHFLWYFTGCFLFALFISSLSLYQEGIAPETFVEFADTLIKASCYVNIGSAVIADRMMGLLGWLITSAQETISRIAIIAIVTFAIGYGKFHHCNPGSIELF